MIKGSFEARKVAYRQTKDGVVVSFVIHPNDAHAELATAPLGIRLMIGYAEIGDDETTATAMDSVEAPARTKEKDPDRSERAREQYVSKSDMEKAVVRASLLCKDPQFQRWACLGKAETAVLVSEENAAEALRQHLHIVSRSHIGWSPTAFERFLELETQYRMDTGQMAEPR